MWLGVMSAQAAAWALIVARGWLVFDMTGSSMDVGMVTFAAMAPMFFVPPIAGVLADKWDRRSLLAGSYAVNLLQNLVLALLSVTGVIAEWHIVLLAVINGVARASQQSTSQALAANLVPADRLLNALSLNAATQHASRLIGPGLASPLLGFLGAPAAFFLCTGLYALGWWQIMGIKTRSTGGVRKGESFVTSFIQGLRYAWREPLIRMVLAMVIFHCGLTMAFESLLPNFAAQQLTRQVSQMGPLLHGDMVNGVEFNTAATGFATLMMGVGAGSLVGSIFVGGLQSGLARGRTYLAMGLLSGVGQVLLSFAPNLGLALVAGAIMGGSQSAFMTMGQALTQALAANEFRGRLASINTFSLGGIMSFMNLANGFLGTQFPASGILLVNGTIFVTIMLASIAFAVPRGVYLRGMPAA
ncbi:MAG: arabinose efflux permease family protein [Chloroflexi bacterium]|nr:arabinose efflux permease family protein [Chloroflexota bacterium]